MLRDDEQIVLKFSKGWLERFKERFDWRCHCVSGEGMSTDDDAICLEMPRLPRRASTYVDADIWNADVYGLSYRQAPSLTLLQGPVSGF